MNNYITEEELAPLAENYMCLYGINVNLARAIPDTYDGLKPVIRRLLYSVYTNYRSNKFKVASAMGDLLKLHPHGDQGLAGVYARLAQSFSNNIPLLSTTDSGNSGNAVAGNDFASPRYLDMKMSKFAMDVFFDEFDGKVNMKPSYDGSSVEPITLPSKFPVILLNGIAGIAYALSSDIYPYNLNEIGDMTIKLIKNPNAKVKLIPDLPTGCDIIIRDETSFVMQSSFDIDNINYIITIKNTPYMRYLDDIDERLRAIQDSSNPISEIISADDESDLINDKIKYVIRCKPCNLYNVINVLFKRVPGFRASISTNNMIVVDNFRTCEYNIRQILCSWIKNRLNDKHGYLLRDLVSSTTERNMLEGKAFMLSPENLNKTIKVFRSCESKEDIIPALIKAYDKKITTSQANYVSELHVYNLTNGEYNKTLKSIDKIIDHIDYIRSIVENPEKIKDVVIDEILSIKSKYGTPRKSKILNGAVKELSVGIVSILQDGSISIGETDSPEGISSDTIPISGDKVCLIDEYSNFMWININKVPHDSPMTLTSIGKIKMGKCVYATSSVVNDVILLTNKGRIKFMPISKIPSNATTKPLIPLDPDEVIVSALEIHDGSMDILIYTLDGLGKRVPISQLNKVSSIDAIGQVIMKYNNVAGMFAIDSKKPYLVYVTRLGKIRVNQSKFLLSGKKFSDPKPIIKLSPQDDLIAVFCVTTNQVITLHHADSRVSTINVDSLPVSTLAMEPVRPKHVPGVKVVRSSIHTDSTSVK